MQLKPVVIFQTTQDPHQATAHRHRSSVTSQSAAASTCYCHYQFIGVAAILYQWLCAIAHV